MYLTTPFACGAAFSVGVLDSLIASTYYNDGLLSFLSVFVNGGVTKKLEALLADEVGVSRCWGFLGIDIRVLPYLKFQARLEKYGQV